MSAFHPPWIAFRPIFARVGERVAPTSLNLK
jgi:hypothetical protein